MHPGHCYWEEALASVSFLRKTVGETRMILPPHISKASHKFVTATVHAEMGMCLYGQVGESKEIVLFHVSF